MRFAENLAKSGAKFAARKVYQSIAAGDVGANEPVLVAERHVVHGVIGEDGDIRKRL